MSLLELPALALPLKEDRSRIRDRLEASLAGLCELDLLKQRQEYRVLSALYLGDAPVLRLPPWSAMDPSNGSGSKNYNIQNSSVPNLQCTPWGPESTLEQQLADLYINTEVIAADSSADQEDVRSGDVIEAKQNRIPDPNHHSLCPRSVSKPDGTGGTEPGEKRLSDPAGQSTTTDAPGKIRDVGPTRGNSQQAQKIETYIFGIIQRKALLARPSKPRTSLTHDARAVSVARQSSLCQKEEQHSSKQATVTEMSGSSQCSEGTNPPANHTQDQQRYLGPRCLGESPPPPYHHHHQKSVQHQSGYCHRPRQASMISSSHSTLLDYTSFRELQAHPDSSNSEPESPQHFHRYTSPRALSKPYQTSPPDEQLVNAEYIPAQPCRASSRAYVHPHPNLHKGSEVPKPNRSTYSPERGHHREEQQPTVSHVQPLRSRGGLKKYRLNEDRGGASRKQGKRGCRSQSENSLQRVPERKYNAVERDGGGSGSGGRGGRSSQSRNKKQPQGGSSYQRWQSTLELSQDEADQSPNHFFATNQKDNCVTRTRKSRPVNASYAYPHPASQHRHHLHYQLESVQPFQPKQNYSQPGPGDSESSMSEADSPDYSSLSSDSDESGGLVWPQQLPPQLSLPSPPAPAGATLEPKAFVKIKASHALKKKILRFRNGSLKVMTTV